eukprot:scaffold50893_cov42-Phaeocystis_antarctica.AAC.1
MPQGSICIGRHMSPCACCTPAPSPTDLGGGGPLGLLTAAAAAAAGPRELLLADAASEGLGGVVATAGLLSRPLQLAAASSAGPAGPAGAEEGR